MSQVIPWTQREQDYAVVPVGTVVENEGRTEACPICGLGSIRVVVWTEKGERISYYHYREWVGEPGDPDAYLGGAARRCVEGHKDVDGRDYLMQLSADGVAALKCKNCGWGTRRRATMIDPQEVYAMAEAHACAIRATDTKGGVNPASEVTACLPRLPL